MSVARTVSEIFDVKERLDLEIWVGGHSRSLQLVLFVSLHGYGFLVPSILRSNYGSILYHFRDKATY